MGANEVQASAGGCVARYRPIAGTVVICGLYTGAAVLFYGLHDGLEPLDAVYLSIATMSTVGYGDLSAADNVTSEAVTVVFIFLGILVVFPELSKIVGQLVAPCFACVRNAIDRRFPQQVIDLDGDGGSDFLIPQPAKIYYAKNLLAPVLVIFVGQFAWAYSFAACEGWEYHRAVYHCMVTATTVGYGDVSIETREGRLLAIFHILFSVSLLGSLIGEALALMAAREDQLKRAEMLKKRLDPERNTLMCMACV